MRIICGDIRRRRLDITIPYLFVEHDLPEAQSAVLIGNMTRVMIPFQVDLRDCEYVPGAVVDTHLHDIIFADERSMGYAGQPDAVN